MSNTLNDLKGDTIDSRDLIEAIEYWQDIVNTYEDEENEFSQEEYDEAVQNLKEIKDFCEPFESLSDWIHGETLIAESHWIDYCWEMVVDCGYLPADLPSWIVVDFEATAENMAVDYLLGLRKATPSTDNNEPLN